jgi:hypothetical protein
MPRSGQGLVFTRLGFTEQHAVFDPSSPASAPKQTPAKLRECQIKRLLAREPFDLTIKQFLLQINDLRN